jgi:hypothetical protein
MNTCTETLVCVNIRPRDDDDDGRSRKAVANFHMSFWHTVMEKAADGGKFSEIVGRKDGARRFVYEVKEFDSKISVTSMLTVGTTIGCKITIVKINFKIIDGKPSITYYYETNDPEQGFSAEKHWPILAAGLNSNTIHYGVEGKKHTMEKFLSKDYARLRKIKGEENRLVEIRKFRDSIGECDGPICLSEARKIIRTIDRRPIVDGYSIPFADEYTALFMRTYKIYEIYMAFDYKKSAEKMCNFLENNTLKKLEQEH